MIQKPSFPFLLCWIALLRGSGELLMIGAFQLHIPRQQPTKRFRLVVNHHIHDGGQEEAEPPAQCRAAHNELNLSINAHTRRKTLTRFVAGAFGLSAWTTSVAGAGAKAPSVSPQQALEDLKFELSNSRGSVTLLENAIDDQNFTVLLEMTKVMDQTLRKTVMGNAKAYLPKDQGDLGQQLCNNVTFDLIGINKSSRPGQESVQKANQYLQELKSDLKQMAGLLEQAEAA